MEQPLDIARQPIFVLSLGRTGSTLLRYLLDSHPDVCCPPELVLGRLCRSLAHTLSLTLAGDRQSPGTASPAQVHAAVRSHVDVIMDAYCAAKQKRRWCDKSTNNVFHLATIDAVFPDAQYICLHRQCLDVVHSLMEFYRFGYPGRYGELVARSPERIADALVDSWTEGTQALLDFEAAHSGRCVRVRYEDFVTNPAVTAERMFSFLGLPFAAPLLDTMFSAPHDPGPGDLKIRFTSGIVQGRSGMGSIIPRNQISDDRLALANTLHHALGYEPVAPAASATLEESLGRAVWKSRRSRQQ